MFSLRNIVSLAVIVVAGVTATTTTTHTERSLDYSHSARSLYDANVGQRLARRRTQKRQSTDTTKADNLVVSLNTELAPLLSQIQATVAASTPLNGATTSLELTALLGALNANIQANIDLAAAIPGSPTPSGTTAPVVDCTTVAQLLGTTIEDVGTSIAAIEGLYSTVAGLQGVVSGAVADTESELTMLIGQLSVILNCLIAVLQTTLDPVLPQLGSLGTTLQTVLGL